MRRTRRSLVAMAMLALIGAGCTNAADTATGSDSGGGSAHDLAVRFAECMRDNGVTAFPDPEPSGELTIDGVVNGSAVDPSTPVFTQASSACKDLEPPGFTGREVVSPEQLDARLEFARCMRDNGVADFPDPAPDAPLVNTNLIPSSATDDGMTILDAAMKTCGEVVADALGGT